MNTTKTETKTKTTNKKPIIELSRALFAPIAISLVILAGCGDENLGVESGALTLPDARVRGCREPSAENLLKNPGFDANVSSWSSEPGASLRLATGNDALGCPHSGSAAGLAESNARIYQCVPVAPAKEYNFGLRASNGVYCDVNTFTEANCAGDDNGLRTQSLWINVDWSLDLGTVGSRKHDLLSFMTTATDKSARVSCYSYSETQDPTQPFYIDTLYLTPSPGGY